MKDRAWLILSTVTLTALIWITADLASHEAYDTWVDVELIAPPDFELQIDGARAGSPNVVTLPLKLRGTKAAVRRFRFEQARAAAPASVAVTIPIVRESDLATGSHLGFSIRDELGAFAGKHGLQINTADQKLTVDYTVDRWIPIELEVGANPGALREALEGGKAEIANPKVVGRFRETALGERGPPDARWQVPIEEELRRHSGQDVATFDVPLRPKWQGIEAKFNPDHITVTARFARRSETQHLTLIPLHVSVAPDLLSEGCLIELAEAEYTMDVDLTVPVGKPSLLNTDVVAFITLKREEVEAANPDVVGGWITRQVRFVFPPGYGDVVVNDPPTVRFRVSEKAAAGELRATPP